ncbi:MAG: hypothetical protein AAF468_12805 [Pseudomonadota bacterium]
MKIGQPEISRRSFVLLSGSLVLSGCVSRAGVPLVSAKNAIALVQARPESLSRTVSLAVINSPQTKYRVDHHGFPAWTWRDSTGDDGYGACVHLEPKTREPYLETQFPKSGRPKEPVSPNGRSPEKYIQYNLAGDWFGRVHKMFPKEWEENWRNPKAHEDGQRLLAELERLLSAPSS